MIMNAQSILWKADILVLMQVGGGGDFDSLHLVGMIFHMVASGPK